MPPEIILASGSPRRRDLLTGLGVRFEVVTAEVDEYMPREFIDPALLATFNAALKADAVAKARPGRWVLAADTIVVLGRRILGKPASLDQAREYLTTLGGSTHEVITGCCLVASDGTAETFSERSRVVFRSLGADLIEKYLAIVPVLDKAGAYALQDHGEWLVERVEGSHDNVLGLPTEALRRVLPRYGLL